jgi:hypothetical protein
MDLESFLGSTQSSILCRIRARSRTGGEFGGPGRNRTRVLVPAVVPGTVAHMIVGLFKVRRKETVALGQCRRDEGREGRQKGAAR